MRLQKNFVGLSSFGIFNIILTNLMVSGYPKYENFEPEIMKKSWRRNFHLRMKNIYRTERIAMGAFRHDRRPYNCYQPWDFALNGYTNFCVIFTLENVSNEISNSNKNRNSPKTIQFVNY